MLIVRMSSEISGVCRTDVVVIHLKRVILLVTISLCCFAWLRAIYYEKRNILEIIIPFSWGKNSAFNKESIISANEFKCSEKIA